MDGSRSHQRTGLAQHLRDPKVVVRHGHVQRGLAAAVLLVHIAAQVHARDQHLDDVPVAVLRGEVDGRVAVLAVREVARVGVEQGLDVREGLVPSDGAVPVVWGNRGATERCNEIPGRT